jgi:hypothetical protein
VAEGIKHSEKVEVGSVVQLKSGDPLMPVREIKEETAACDRFRQDEAFEKKLVLSQLQPSLGTEERRKNLHRRLEALVKVSASGTENV